MPGQLRGRAPLPLDAGLGPELVRALPRGKTRPFGTRTLGTCLVGPGGLEARAARAAVARLGRAQGPAGWLRRQRGGPGSVRLAGGRGHGAGVRPGAGGRGWAVRLWFGGGPLTRREALFCDRPVGRPSCRCGGNRCRGPGRERGRAGRIAGQADRPGAPERRRAPGGRPAATGRSAGTIRRGARRRARNRARRVALRQTAAGRGSEAGTGLAGRGRVGRLGVGIRLPRTRDDQPRRNRPGRHEVFRVIPAEKAGMLPLFLPRVLSGDGNVTIPTRLVTFCTHHRPQSRHTFLANTTACRSSHFPVQTG